MFSRKLTRSIVVGVAAIAIGGTSYGIVSATSSSGSAPASSGSAAPSSGFAGGRGSGGGGSNARSGPAAGGAVGTVGSVSTSGFTISTSAGQKVTVNEAPSTTYQKGTSSASASAITAGEPVLVLGTTSGTANYSQGSGTIVSGTAANKATEAALAAYPGGIVDRVVKLGNGEYEVHNIGVNWPHHVFVNQDFKVVGAD